MPGSPVGRRKLLSQIMPIRTTPPDPVIPFNLRPSSARDRRSCATCQRGTPPLPFGLALIQLHARSRARDKRLCLQSRSWRGGCVRARPRRESTDGGQPKYRGKAIFSERFSAVRVQTRTIDSCRRSVSIIPPAERSGSLAVPPVPNISKYRKHDPRKEWTNEGNLRTTVEGRVLSGIVSNNNDERGR